MGYLFISLSLILCLFIGWNRAKTRGCQISSAGKQKQMLSWLGVSIILTIGLILLFGISFTLIWLVASLFSTMFIVNLIIRGLFMYRDSQNKRNDTPPFQK